MSSIPATSTPPTSLRRTGLAVCLLAIGAIAGSVGAGSDPDSAWLWLHWLCKPTVTLLILWVAWSSPNPVSMRYQRWIVGGTAASTAGDIFLMLPGDFFVHGLVSFLLAHLAFLVALTTDARFGVRPVALLACLAYGAFNLWALWPSLPDELHIPVIVYIAVLASMGGQAVARAWHHVHAHDALAGPAWLAAAGALLFLLSDTLLAWNKFRIVLPWSALWVLGTYYGAMWLLARSVAQAERDA